MSAGILQLVAVLAGVATGMAAIAGLLWGVWTYRRNGEAQTQLIALGALQHHLDQAVAHPDLATRGEGQPVDARYAWFAAQALVTAQTLWMLVGTRPEWRRSIRAIIRQHCAFLRSDAFVREDFDPRFLDFIRAEAGDVACAPQDASQARGRTT